MGDTAVFEGNIGRVYGCFIYQYSRKRCDDGMSGALSGGMVLGETDYGHTGVVI